MTRGEVADFLEKCRWWFEPFTSEKEQWNEALDIAIEALTQESTQDLISRQAAIKNAHLPVIDDAGYEVVRVDDILALPSAEPKTKCIAQIRINRDDMEDLVNEKVNEIVDKMKETKTGEWIPISEGLPEHSYTKKFWLTVKLDDDEGTVVTLIGTWGAWGGDKGDKSYDAFDCWKDVMINGGIYRMSQPIPKEQVLAWMPLPEPYREDGEA